MEFIKISNNKFKVDVPIDIQMKVTTMLNELSLNDADGYVNHLNAQLLNSMYARIIASHFFNSSKFEVGAAGFVVIDAYIGKEIVSISLGKSELKDQEPKKLAGVMYI